MVSLEALQNILSGAFSTIKIPGEPPRLYEPIHYTMQQGGKRIRPLLVLLGCDLFNGPVIKALPVAVGIELFHNFTLLHDDIMDRAPLRRGKETVFRKWNSNVAILSGDTLFTLAYESLGDLEPEFLPGILKLFTRTARQVCEGQQVDMDFEEAGYVSVDAYLSMIRLKTAVLLACSLASGAIVAGASQENIDRVYEFGENLGMAFQLQDDLLDSYGKEETFGKEIGGDIVVNKKTFLYVAAMEVAGEKERESLIETYSRKDLPAEEKIRKVKEIFDRLGIRDITDRKITEYFRSAENILAGIPLPEENKMNLAALSGRLISRNY
jgi:geranylgeranyl diphosphate synthase type II